MPITRKQFEIGIDVKVEEWMKKVGDFLTEHKEEAFSKEELRQHYSPNLIELLSEREKRLLKLSGERDAFDLLPGERQAFDLALEKLVELGRAEKRIIRDIDYFSYSESESSEIKVQHWG